jgi:hypothetical protein
MVGLRSSIHCAGTPDLFIVPSAGRKKSGAPMRKYDCCTPDRHDILKAKVKVGAVKCVGYPPTREA